MKSHIFKWNCENFHLELFNKSFKGKLNTKGSSSQFFQSVVSRYIRVHSKVAIIRRRKGFFSPFFRNETTRCIYWSWNCKKFRRVSVELLSNKSPAVKIRNKNLRRLIYFQLKNHFRARACLYWCNCIAFSRQILVNSCEAAASLLFCNISYYFSFLLSNK